jgi:hypothetical protein
MPNQHKHSPMSVRLPESLRQWVLDRKAATGLPVNQIIVQAVGAYAHRLRPKDGGGESP